MNLGEEVGGDVQGAGKDGECLGIFEGFCGEKREKDCEDIEGGTTVGSETTYGKIWERVEKMEYF